MSKKKSKLDKIPASYKRQIQSALDRTMRWVGSQSEPSGDIVYYGSNHNENASKVEVNRNG